MMQISRLAALLLILFLGTFATSATALAGNVTASYLYNLANFEGVVPYSGGSLVSDRFNNELFVLSGEAVTIFNSSGMETFRIEYDPSLGSVYDVAFKPDGNMLFLAHQASQMRIALCDYRGEILSFIKLRDLPTEFADFAPSRIFYHDGRLYMANLSSMQVVVTDGSGSFLKGYNISDMLNMTEQESADSGISGFNLSDEGNMLFVVGATAQVYKMEYDGRISGFGRRGSGPGKFGVPTAVATDRNGNYLVSDRLRGVVVVFDKNFKFLTEFGFRGFRPGNLIVPGSIAVDSNNRVYVTQLRRRGVNVYQLRYE